MGFMFKVHCLYFTMTCTLYTSQYIKIKRNRLLYTCNITHQLLLIYIASGGYYYYYIDSDVTNED